MVAIPATAANGDFLVPLGSGKKMISALVIDSGSGTRPGGTGERFDWEDAKVGIMALGMEVPIVVAGGLTPENVSRAIRILRPWGVDVASGVEARPGKKDPEKIREFVKTVREMDRRTN